MKKLCLLMVCLLCLGFWVFADDTEQEEVDFLIFSPNSSEQFENEEQAMLQLDNLARYLLDRNLAQGQIFVYGYAAAVVNDILGEDLSRDRAIFVRNELQRRGVPQGLFSEPIGHGEVDLWGNNVDEENRSPNRRVRIMLDGDFLTPLALTRPVTQAARPAEPRGRFPWWLLLLLLLLLLLFALLRRRKKPAQAAPVAAAAVPVAVVPVAAAATYEEIKNIEEEIRLQAFFLSLQRGDGEKNPVDDWYTAVRDVSARYLAIGYDVYPSDDSWWVRRTTTVSEK